MKTAGLFKLNLKDFVKGLIVAILGAVVGIVADTVNSGSLNFNWKVIGSSALVAGLGYLLKNLGTNNKDEFLKKDV